MADQPIHPLAGVIAKLRRVDAQLVFLHDEIRRYLDGRPYSLSTERDPSKGGPGYAFHVVRQPPLNVSVIVGEIVHNLRSSLDYVARELITRNGFTPYWGAQFPICTTETDFFTEAINQNRLAGISLRAFNIIAELQPYKMRAGKETIHPLWHLAKISNLDKHRTLALSALGTSCLCIFTHPDGRKHRSELTNSTTHDGAVIASMPVEFFHEEVKTEAQISCQVCFRDPPVTDLEVMNILQLIREWLGQLVVPAFEPFFDKLPDDLRLRSHGLPQNLWSKDRNPLDRDK